MADFSGVCVHCEKTTSDNGGLTNVDAMQEYKLSKDFETSFLYTNEGPCAAVTM